MDIILSAASNANLSIMVVFCNQSDGRNFLLFFIFVLECSKKVVELARKYNYLIVTDDVYHWFQFVSPNRKRMLYYDKLCVII